MVAVLSFLNNSGWKVQEESMSFDKQTVYFSAICPGGKQYDLYYSRHESGNRSNGSRTNDNRTNGWTEPVALPAEVNSEQWDDLWPSISPDEQELYFVRRWLDETGKKPVWKQDIYLAHREGDGWGKAAPLIISDGGMQSPLILADGQTLLFSSCHQGQDAKHPHYGIYYTRKSGKTNWLIPELVQMHESSEVNLYGPQVTRNANGSYQVQATLQTIERKDTSYSRTSFVLPEKMQPLPLLTLSGLVKDAANGKRLPATLTVKDAVTQTHIATHKTDALGAYVVALPQGKVYSLDITTDGYSHRYLDYDCLALQKDSTATETIELTPTLSVTIYLFDSETNAALGEEKKVLAINKLYDIPLERRGYESQHLALDTRKAVLLPSSELDVLLVPGKAPMTIRLYDSESGEAVEGDITLANQSREQLLHYERAGLTTRQGDTYQLAVNAVGYIYYDTLVSVPLSAEPIEMDIRLLPIRQSMVLQLRNIQFETASADLKEESYVDLDKVVRLLKDNPELRIELSAHTDDQGTDIFNKRLSERRGESAKRYIIRHGIDPERVTSRGYGKSQPLVPNDSEEHRAMNRRVEFKVVEL